VILAERICGRSHNQNRSTGAFIRRNGDAFESRGDNQDKQKSNALANSPNMFRHKLFVTVAPEQIEPYPLKREQQKTGESERLPPRLSPLHVRYRPAPLVANVHKEVMGISYLQNPQEDIMSFGIYMIGYIILIVGLAIGAHLLRVPPRWIGVGVICMMGFG